MKKIINKIFTIIISSSLFFACNNMTLSDFDELEIQNDSNKNQLAKVYFTERDVESKVIAPADLNKKDVSKIEFLYFLSENEDFEGIIKPKTITWESDDESTAFEKMYSYDELELVPDEYIFEVYIYIKENGKDVLVQSDKKIKNIVNGINYIKFNTEPSTDTKYNGYVVFQTKNAVTFTIGKSIVKGSNPETEETIIIEEGSEPLKKELDPGVYYIIDGNTNDGTPVSFKIESERYTYVNLDLPDSNTIRISETEFILNNGKFVNFEQKLDNRYYINTIFPDENYVTRDGFTFDGWYDTEDFSGSRVEKFQAGKLYARWIKYVESIEDLKDDGSEYYLTFNESETLENLKNKTQKYTNSKIFVDLSKTECSVEWEFTGNKVLSGIILSKEQTDIRRDAFSDATKLTSVEFLSDIDTIGEMAFQNCTNLKSITITGLNMIEDYAFEGCSNLESVKFYGDIKKIGENVFYRVDSLKEIFAEIDVCDDDIFEKNITNLKKSLLYPEGINIEITGVVSKNLKSKLGSNAASIINKIKILEPVTEICSEAFKDTKITSVEIPSTVTTIGKRAFYNCASLEEITIPESVTTIGEYAFYKCKSLTEIVIPEGVTTIADALFNNCESLTEITISESVTTIGEYAFGNCTSLTEITIPASLERIGNSAFYKCTSLKEVTIPESVETIGEYAFCECKSLTEVTIPEGVTTIGKYAFDRCTSLKEVTISESVETIGSYAFYKCTSLKEITIPEGVTTIGSYAFDSCTSLTKITIPSSVTTIGEDAFYGCPLEEATICLHEYADNEQTVKTNYTNLVETLSSCKTLTKLNLGTLGYLNLQDFPYVTEVEVFGVDSIPANSFKDCAKLNKITINEGVTTIDDHVFDSCTSLDEITLPESVTTIGRGAFYKCTSLTEITIPKNVTEINYGTFENCKSLQKVIVLSDEIGFDMCVFVSCNELVYLEVPNEHNVSFDGLTFFQCEAPNKEIKYRE